jgi:spermidine synthase
MARPWRVLDRIDTDQGLLDLRQRGEHDFLITIDGRVLMNSSGNLSEIALARLACEHLQTRQRPRVLVGGLGMGFTLRAALDSLPADARVTVAELNPVMVDWCRGSMAHLTDRAVDDPRVRVVIGDVAARIRDAAIKGKKSRFDAIILDLYAGPREGVDGRDDPVYGDVALELSRAALTADGVLAVWSEDPDRAFERRLKAARFEVRCHRPGRGGRHVVYIAAKAEGSGAAPDRKQSGRKRRRRR